MSRDRRGDGARPASGVPATGAKGTPGKRTLTEMLPVQGATEPSPGKPAPGAGTPTEPPFATPDGGMLTEAQSAPPGTRIEPRSTPSDGGIQTETASAQRGSIAVGGSAAVQRAPAPPAAGASVTSPDPGVAPPRASIDKTGFIDNSDGANLRTGPAQVGGKPLLEAPLPPATRVFVSGTHPGAPDWWYVTAYLERTLVRGYVQGFRVNVDLPEPLAELRQLVGGETAEGLAREKFGGAVRDGHDLRYYENVLLHVNQQRHRAGITGRYQAPGVLGGGSNNIQLFAGHRIWLVSPAYARALEGSVPDGSLTGGAVAKVKRFVGHLEDILQSVTESRRHLDEVAGEFAQAIHEHLAAIVGIVAGFIMAEAASMFLAAAPTGVSQAAAAMVQLVLAAFGAAGMVEAGLEALKHGSQWLVTAWTAGGDAEKIGEASKEFLRMLIALAIAALGLLGAKGNYNNALTIAGKVPTGGLPAFAVASSAGKAGPGARAGVSIGPSTGAIGPAGARMAQHGGEGDGGVVEAPRRDKPPRSAEAEGDAASGRATSAAHDQPGAASERPAAHDKPGAASDRPAAHDSPGAASERSGVALEGAGAAGKGRDLPECPVAESTIEPEVIDSDPRALEYVITGKAAGGKRVDFGSVELELTPRGEPAKPPTMSLQASAFVDGQEHAARIYPEVVVGPAGRAVGQGERIPLTLYVLRRFGRFYERRFGYPLKAWAGRLAFENKLNFQREYARLIELGAKPGAATAVDAVKKISYGRHRLAENFSRISVRINDPAKVDLGEGFGIRSVPTEIDVLAEMP